jgi:hypothetical protein
MPLIDPSVVPQARAEQGGVAAEVKGVEDQPAAAVRPAATRPDPAPGPVSLAGSSGSGLEGSSPPQAALNASGPEPTSASQAQPRVGGSNAQSDRDVVVWLHQRMVTLQQERETRWQKILKLLPGLT